MWKLNTDEVLVKLPIGFYLMKNEDFVLLYYNEKRIACFSSRSADPKEIEKVANEYVKHINNKKR
ncbi:MAG TPA: hypothetical protein PLL80_00445 [Candidatus Pacearchaeota archaeon]|nr:hypothetical protein [Candidatus Pacearchaeota archaeon]HOK93999.1 hypothetical protein [Candidatus Pacearchaeota archaeon]HPO75070.1 hypothetical protein [Candidatus Pacearchaeota archaeon]